MQKVVQAMEGKLTAEQKVQKDLLAYQISVHFQTIRSLYIESLQGLISDIEPPEDFLFIRSLIYDKSHCHRFFCYRNTYLSTSNEVITVHTQRHQLSLTQKTLITCQITQTNGVPTISIFHNIIASKTKQIYIPDNKMLPHFNVSSLHIHTLQRKLTEVDLLDKNIVLLHDDQQIAFQCVTPATLEFDGVPYECLSTTLNWFSPPTVVTNRATGNIIMNADKMKTAHARWTLEDLNSPIPVEQLIIRPSVPRLSDKISDYFNKTDPIRASLISGSTLIVIIILTLPCAIRCCCPNIVKPCWPINYLREQRSKRKIKRASIKAARQLSYAKSITDNTPSAPTLEDIDASIRLLHKNVLHNNAFS